jgi:hypothetical protein
MATDDGKIAEPMTDERVQEHVDGIKDLFSDVPGVEFDRIETMDSTAGKNEIGVAKAFIGEFNGLRFCLVNGGEIAVKKDMDFVEGGNGMRYPGFIPKDEIWPDACLDGGQLPFVALHESIETELMRGGMPYDDAHAFANARERIFRLASMGWL